MNNPPGTDHPASLSIEQLRKSCEFRTQRRSGPGGQHRNKVETAVSIRHRPTGIIVAASERRSQAANLAVAWRRLRVKLALEVRTQWRQPSELWISRCHQGRLQISPNSDALPALLAEALNVIDRSQDDIAQAAASLQCTTSQLVKLLKRVPAALQRVNYRRQQNQLPPLR